MDLCHSTRCDAKEECIELSVSEQGINAAVIYNNTNKSLSRQLLDASGKKGRFGEVKRLIDVIGSDFPSVRSIHV